MVVAVLLSVCAESGYSLVVTDISQDSTDNLCDKPTSVLIKKHDIYIHINKSRNDTWFKGILNSRS
ncbi:hypothetical protein BS78_09G176900 [Paspalum vaginatum]|nr:hypothetical protein BS78_09G176900 [Paspalum vaginatum]